MIIVGKSVSHIRPLVAYVYKEEKLAYVLDSDGLDLDSVSTILQDFETIENNRLKNQYLSLVISPAEEKLDDDTFRDVLRDTLAELELDNNQFLAIIHANTEHKHAHVLINRTNYNNKTFNDSYIGLKAMELSKAIAKKHNLQSAYDKRYLAPEKIHFKDNLYHNNLEIVINELKEMVKQVVYNPSTLDIDDVYDHLIKNGVNVDVTKYKNGSFGVKLEYNEIVVKASQVSRLITIVPDGETYKANKLLEPILEKNFEHSLKKRTQSDIIEDLTNDPQNAKIYYEELQALKQSMLHSLQSNQYDDNSENEEKQLKYQRNKNRKDKRRLGFKVDF
jgi:hypothetical protein